MIGAGMLVACQVAINSRLRDTVDSPGLSALISFAVGTAALATVVYSEQLGGAGRGLASIRLAPWWAFLGGIFGAAYVVLSIVALPRLGTAVVVVATVTGQLIASLLIDSLGWFGVQPVPLTWWRGAGAALLILGLLLLVRR